MTRRTPASATRPTPGPGSRGAARAAASATGARAGRPLRDERTLARIRALAIPPAWTDVWICSDARGHLQATGRDARGRKQYLYHPDWRTLRDETKFDRMEDFGAALPGLRDRIERRPRPVRPAARARARGRRQARRRHADPRRQRASTGAPTARSAPRRSGSATPRSTGSRVSVEFRGKGGKLQHAEVADRRLARTVQRLHDLPGRELFEYLDDDGERQRACTPRTSTAICRRSAATS